MANEIKTRILLKYDSYTNWEASEFILKKGEAAVCEMSNTVDTSGDPTILVKYGNGKDKFADLPWTSALAADVYAWAKESGIHIESGNTNGSTANGALKVVTGLRWVATDAHPNGALVVDYAYAAQKSDITTALGDYATKEYANQAEADAVSTAKAYTDALANGQVTTNKNNIAALVKQVGDLEAAGGQVNVIESVKVDGTALTITDKAVNIDLANATVANAGTATTATKLGGTAAADYLKKSEATGYGDILTKTVAASTYQPKGDYATAAQGAKADSAVQSVKVLGETLTNGGELTVAEAKTALGLKSAAYTASTDYATAAQGTKADNAAAAIATYGDIVTHNVAEFEKAGVAATKAGEALESAKDYTDEEIIGLELALSDSTINLTNKAGTVVASLDASQFIKDGMLESVAYDEADNALTFIWNTSAGITATTIQLDDLVDTYTGVTGSKVKVSVSGNAISADIVAESIAKADLVTAVQTSLGKADTAVQSIKVLGETLTDGGELTVAEAKTALGLKSAAYTESSAYATAAQGALADSALQAADITTGSANGTIAVNGTNVAVKGLGSAAYTASTAYATAAQGTKADDAVPKTTTVNGHALSANITLDAADVGAATTADISTAINALDVSDISGFGAGKTLKTLTETNGKIAATFQDISITASQVSDFSTKVAAVKVASATAADKATQDASGNVITSTYATKTEVSAISTKVGALTTDDIDGGTETWIFKCGSATENIAD